MHRSTWFFVLFVFLAQPLSFGVFEIHPQRVNSAFLGIAQLYSIV